MIAKPTNRDQLIHNAIDAAENAHMAAQETARGAGSDHAVAWSAASRAWSEIASLVSEERDVVMDDLSAHQDTIMRGVVHEFYTEKTLAKVRAALTEATGPYGHGEDYVTDLISAIQNEGVLFREHAPDSSISADLDDGQGPLTVGRGVTIRTIDRVGTERVFCVMANGDLVMESGPETQHPPMLAVGKPLTEEEWETIQALRDGTATVTPAKPAQTVGEGVTMSRAPHMADPVFLTILHTLALRAQGGRGPLRITDQEIHSAGMYAIAADRVDHDRAWVVRVSARS